MRTHRLQSLVVVAVTFTVACDPEKDSPPCEGAECNDEGGDDEDDSAEPEPATGESGEASGGSGEVGGSGEASGGAAEGAEPLPVPEECTDVCACVEMLGGDRAGCGQTCAAAMADEDPNDRAQCEEALAQNGDGDCAPECAVFSDGT